MSDKTAQIVDRFDAFIGGAYDWQKRFVERIMRPGTETAALSVPRGAGKSFMLSALAAAVFESIDDPNAYGEIIIVGPAQETVNASIFAPLQLMLRKTDVEFHKVVSGTIRKLTRRDNQVQLKIASCKASTLMGANSFLILCDEVSSWYEVKAGEVLAVLQTSLGKRENAKMICASTRGTNPAVDPFERWMQKETDYKCIYQADTKSPDYDPYHISTWMQANPSLTHQKTMQKTYRREAKRAKKDTASRNKFLALRLNLGGDLIETQYLIEPEPAEALEGDADREGAAFCAIDHSAGLSMSAGACYWVGSGRLDVFGLMPSEPGPIQRAKEWGLSPELVAECVERKELIIVEGEFVGIDVLLSEVLQRFGQVQYMTADRFRRNEVKAAMHKSSLTPEIFVFRNMRWKEATEDITAFRECCYERKLTITPNKLLRLSLSQCRTRQDNYDNETFEPSKIYRLNDAAIASCLAVSAGYRWLKSQSKVDDAAQS